MRNIGTRGTDMLPSARPTFRFVWSCAASLLLFATAASSASWGVVVIFDGFGDGDRNNNGTAFEDVDVVGTYQPFFDEDTMTRDDSPLIFPAGQMVVGPTVADDVNDVGIRWTSTGGITNSGTGDPSAAPRIINDAAGHMPETVGSGVGFFNAISSETQFVPALDDGLALGFEGKGRTRSISGFFEADGDYTNGKQSTISLGPKVDDMVRVSFDFRVWLSAPNFNTESNTNHMPNRAEIRFGIYNDADNELGLTNNFAGPNFTPAVWGFDDGAFRGDLIAPDATGDPGWFFRLPLADKDTPLDELFGPFPNGAGARINEETNVGSGNAAIHLQGSGTNNGGDVQTVAQPDSLNPNFVNMETEKRYHIEFALRRFDETGGSTDPNVDGDNIEATVTVTDIDNPTDTFSFSGFDPLDPDMLDPDAGFSSEAWDYFAIGTGGASVSDGLDFVLDNFTIEVIGSNEPVVGTTGDDLLVIQRTDPSGIPQWEQNYGLGSASRAAAAAVPEPTSAFALCLSGMLVAGFVRRR